MPDSFHADGFGYYNGADRVGVTTRVPHGKGHRDIVVMVKPADIVARAEALRPVMGAEEAAERGHAFWHWKNARPVPCALCRTPAPGVLEEPVAPVASDADAG